jgi:DNA topoisomerase-1
MGTVAAVPFFTRRRSRQRWAFGIDERNAGFGRLNLDAANRFAGSLPLQTVADDAPAPLVRVLAAAALSYSRPGEPGIRREGAPDAFRYRDVDGRLVRRADILKRIRALAIPPAWTSVWICADPDGHLQATGRDARGRLQYRYHAQWRAQRDQHKFHRLADFANALPAIRSAVERDLAAPGLTRRRLLAAMVSLLDRTFIRVGDERYRRDNGSFGLTTLRTRHVRVSGDRIRLRFRGKSGKEHDVSLADRRLARIVRRCLDLPGYELFQYVEDGEPRRVCATDVNVYLQEISGADYTAKDFRTWGATVIATVLLTRYGPASSIAERTRTVNRALRAAAHALGNTLAVCRKSYVHPGVVDAYVADQLPRRRLSDRPDGLRAAEWRTLVLLRHVNPPARRTRSRAQRERRTRDRSPVLAAA